MKTAKYTDPQTLYRVWMAPWLFPVEVGCRSFPVWITLSSLGIVGNNTELQCCKLQKEHPAGYG